MKIKSSFTGKVLFASIVLQTFVLFSPVIVRAAGAREYEVPPCYDITGRTTPVDVESVNNGGVLDFDDVGVAPAQQACVRMKADLSGPDHLEGWVWDDNLGWVSLYCPGGPGAKGQNLGISCGSIKYKVDFKVSGGAWPNYTNVTMSGYAWGDNIGWISFDSKFHQMAPMASGVNRGLISPVSSADDRHAWAETVGWLDWSGVWFHWEDTDPPVVDPDVQKYISICSSKDLIPYVLLTDPKCTCDLDGTCPVIVDENKVPDANGIDKYDIEIPFVDNNMKIPDTRIEQCAATSVPLAQMTAGGKEYCARLELTWEDGVDYNQTLSTSQNQTANPFGSNNNGATRKPIGYGLFGGSAPDFVYVPGAQLWGADVKSFAPTSERNSFDGMENEKFYFNSDLSGYNPSLTDQNVLKLKELKLLFFKYGVAGAQGECIYGNIKDGKCEMRNYMKAGGTTLSFNPLLSANKLSYVQGNKDLNFINITSPDLALNFSYNTKVKAEANDYSLEMKAGLQDADSVYRMKFINTAFPVSPDNEARDAVETLFPAIGAGVKQAQLFSDSLGATFSPNAGPYVYTIAKYATGGHDIKYFSTKLPRVKAGLLLNPVAKIQGNVYVTDLGKKASDVTLRSLGNVSSNLRREGIVRNIARYLSGYATSLSTGPKIVSTGDVNLIGGLNELVNDKVFYVKDGNLTIDCGVSCTFDKNVTFIVENGNILVNSDLLTNGKSQIGLIAIRNLEGNVKNQGFIYLDKNVTWLQNTQIYADRVLQSYDKSKGLNLDSNGFAKIVGDDYERQQNFQNQLVIEGTVSSMNGIGNASGNPATDENGLKLNGSGYCSDYGNNLSGLCRARVVDLNYLRYYGPGLEICTGLEGAGALANVPRDQALRTNVAAGGGCNPAFAGYDVDASNLYDVDNTTDLVSGGGSGKRSDYFAVKRLPKTLVNEFPVNFFYKPIAKDLAGFEVDQAVNPLLQN